MSADTHPLANEIVASVGDFNSGDLSAATKLFSDQVVFTAPGHSAVAGDYRARDGVAKFFGKMYELSGGTLSVEQQEVLADDEHLVLFLRFTANRGSEQLAVTVAGFHSDRAPDGWRRATFLPDDLAAFDRFFAA